MSRYDWTEWFSMLAEYGSLVLHEDRDYICSQRMMIQQLRNQANKRQVSITVNEYKGWLLIELIEVQQ